jgi:hypothetical protein
VRGAAVEMTAHGRGGKPKAGFPPRPQALEIAQDAIPTFPPPRRGAEKWKTKSTFPHFPACCLWNSKPTRKGDLAAGRYAPAFRLILRLENAASRLSGSAAPAAEILEVRVDRPLLMDTICPTGMYGLYRLYVCRRGSCDRAKCCPVKRSDSRGRCPRPDLDCFGWRG